MPGDSDEMLFIRLCHVCAQFALFDIPQPQIAAVLRADHREIFVIW
jgi:hypothetical protein